MGFQVVNCKSLPPPPKEGHPHSIPVCPFPALPPPLQEERGKTYRIHDTKTPEEVRLRPLVLRGVQMVPPSGDSSLAACIRGPTTWNCGFLASFVHAGLLHP